MYANTMRHRYSEEKICGVCKLLIFDKYHVIVKSLDPFSGFAPFLLRLILAPLLLVMLAAAVTVHWDNGWVVITPTDPDTSAARILLWHEVPGALESLDNTVQAR